MSLLKLKTFNNSGSEESSGRSLVDPETSEKGRAITGWKSGDVQPTPLSPDFY